MKKYNTHFSIITVVFLILLLCNVTASHATAWTTRTKGDITNLTNWTNGTSSPVSFTTPGDTWAITDTMTMSSPSWTVGTLSMSPATVTFAAGGAIIDTTPGATHAITIYGNVVGNGGTYSSTGNNANITLNVYGNTIITLGSFSSTGDNAHFTFIDHGTFTMSGGLFSVIGNNSVHTVNFFGNCNLTGTSAMVSSGSGSAGSVHFALPYASGTMLINNSSTGAWTGMDFYIDSGCTARLNGNFTTNTGTAANGLTVKGRLICPEVDSVTGTNNFNLNAGGALVVAHAAGVNGAIVSTGTNTFSDSATYGFNGIVPQVTGSYMPPVLWAPDTIIVDNPTGLTLSHPTSTTGVLNFIDGILHTGVSAFTVVGHAANVVNAGPGRYVTGTFTKTIAGDSIVTYEVGDSSYAPLTLKFDMPGTSGSISVNVTYGLHPSAGSSILSTTNMVNHFWTVATASPTGPSKVKVKSIYNLADILGGSNTLFSTQHYDGSFWLTTPIHSTNTVAPYTTTTDSTIAIGGLPGDYIFGQRNGILGEQPALSKSNECLRIFPNPVTSMFSLTVNTNYTENAHIIICNVAGEKVKELTTITNKATEISLSEARGIYTVTATTAHGSYSQKVIVND